MSTNRRSRPRGAMGLSRRLAASRRWVRVSCTRGRLEGLEDRRLLAADPLELRFDVDGDGVVAPLDALTIFNRVAAHGPSLLAPAVRTANLLKSSGPSAMSAAAETDPDARFDLNGDGFVSMLDGLQIVQALNGESDELVRIRLEATDLAGNVITALQQGQDFILRAFVTDLRSEMAVGVYAAYLDVLFDPSLAAVVGALVHQDEDLSTPDYINGISGDTLTPGLIDEVGGFIDSFGPLDAGEYFLFSVRMRAVAGGVLVFTGDPADNLPLHDVLLLGMDDPVDPSLVQYIPVTLTITPLPPLSIDDVQILEGDSGSQVMVFTVTLLADSDDPITVQYETVGVTATEGVDYLPAAGTLVFSGGVKERTIQVTVIGDLLNEADETFIVQLSNPQNGSLLKAQGVGTITNDDPVPLLSVSDAGGFEGFEAVFLLSLSAPSGQSISVNFSTLGATATEGVDFTHTSGTVQFVPGVTTAEIRVPLTYDTQPEGIEQFLLELSGPVNVALASSFAIGSIRDLPFSSLSGYVYADGNILGVKEPGEPGLQGVLITLSGIDFLGQSVHRQAITAADGSYSFLGLLPGTYDLVESQPIVLEDGADSVGTQGGTIVANDHLRIVLGIDVHGTDNNFGEGALTDEFNSQANFFASSLNGRKG